MTRQQQQQHQQQRSHALSLEVIITSLIVLLTAVTNYFASKINNALTTLHGLSFYPFKPTASTAPKPNAPRIAIIGGGITGVSSAATCIRSGCDVTIFESTGTVGGIWSRTNKTSSLQTHSLMYRFHPLVSFPIPYPFRDSILDNLKTIWSLYDLKSRTRLNTTVKSVKPNPGRKGTWLVATNTGAPEIYDGVIVAVGTCGPPNIPSLPGLEDFENPAVHSSKMETLNIPQKPKEYNLVVVGSGASAVEAVDFIANHFDDAKKELGPGKLTVTILARSDKWICPRGILTNSILAMWPAKYGKYMQWLVTELWYGKSLQGMVPSKPLYASTPCLNTKYLQLVRSGHIRYIRGSFAGCGTSDVIVENVEWDSSGRSTGDEKLHLPASAIVYSTGYKRPSLDFIDESVFMGPGTPSSKESHRTSAHKAADARSHRYDPPNMHLVAFAPGHPTLLLSNDAFVDAVATAGHFHIGMYARILVMHVLDAAARPTDEEAVKWVEAGRSTNDQSEGEKKKEPKSQAATAGAGTLVSYNRWKEKGLGFVTYGELCAWCAKYIVASRERTPWALYISGWRYAGAVERAHQLSVAAN